MAEFDKADIADAPVLNQSRASEGYRGNTSFGTLVEAFGSGLKQATEAAYQGSVGYIKQEAMAGIDQARSDFGVDAAVDFKTGINNPRVTPEEINNAGDRLKMLDTAYKSGKLRESNYRAQLELVSRQLRYRWPGFREEIDQIMSQATGSLPANAVRNALMEEALKKDHDEDSPEKRRQNLIDWMTKEGIILPPDYQDRDLDSLRGYTNNETAKRYNNASIRDKITTEQAVRTDRDTRGEDAFRVQLAQEAATVLNNSFGIVAKNNEQFTAIINKMRSGQPLQGQEREFALQLMNKTKAEIGTRVAQMKLDWAGKVPAEKINKEVEALYARHNEIEDSMLNQKTGLLTFHANAAKLETDNANYNLLKKYPQIANINAIKENLGPDLANTVLLQSGTLPNLASQLSTMVINDTLDVNGGSLSKNLDKIFEEGIKSKPAFDFIMKSLQSAVESDSVNDRVTGRVLDALYNDKNTNIIAYAGTNDKANFVLQMANPSYVKSIRKKLDQGVINQNQWNTYKSWLEDSATRVLRVEASTANQIVSTRKKMSLAYDDKQHILVTGERNEETGLIQRGVEYALEGAAKSSVDEVNKLLMGLSTVYKAEGIDPNTKIPDMIAKMGIDLNAQRQPTALDSVWEAIQKAATRESPLFKAMRAKAAKSNPDTPIPVTTTTVPGIPVDAGPIETVQGVKIEDRLNQ